MLDAIFEPRQLLALGLGAVTMFQMWKVGDRTTWAWALGIANQGLWLAFIVVFEAWGLLPLNVGMVVTYARNLAKWRREERSCICRSYHRRTGLHAEACPLA